jgi:hypothetical protein
MILKSKSLAYEEIKIDDEAERMAFYEKCGPCRASNATGFHQRSASGRLGWFAGRFGANGQLI